MDLQDLATRIAQHVAELAQDSRAIKPEEHGPEDAWWLKISLNAATLNTLTWGFAADAEIWTEFRRIVDAVAQAGDQVRGLLRYETVAKWSSVARAQRQLARIESELTEAVNPAQQQSCAATLADARHHLEMAKASNLQHMAIRINNQAGGTVTDGITLQVLVQVMGNEPALWREFVAAIEPARG